MTALFDQSAVRDAYALGHPYTYFSDVRLAGLQAHIEAAIRDNHLPKLQAEQFRAHLQRVISARDRMAKRVSLSE